MSMYTGDNPTDDRTMSNLLLAAPPKTLGDFVMNCQRLSAALPPDGWVDGASSRRLERRESGTLSWSPASPLNRSRRRASSTPASVPYTGTERTTTAPIRQRYCVATSASSMFSHDASKSQASSGRMREVPSSEGFAPNALVSQYGFCPAKDRP